VGTLPKNTSAWSAEEQQLLTRHRNGETVVVNQRRHADLIRWAKDAGVYEPVDRTSRWGNPFVLPRDGTRDQVIAAYRDDHLPTQPSLTADIATLEGQVLGCWCAPAACHADILAEAADQRSSSKQLGLFDPPAVLVAELEEGDQ